MYLLYQLMKTVCLIVHFGVGSNIDEKNSEKTKFKIDDDLNSQLSLYNKYTELTTIIFL